MTDCPKLEVLVGKYFIATFPHWSGHVEGVIDSAHYLVRFDPGSDGSPEAFAVVAIDDMVSRAAKRHLACVRPERHAYGETREAPEGLK
jgi:hypothetical protein